MGLILALSGCGQFCLGSQGLLLVCLIAIFIKDRADGLLVGCTLNRVIP